MNLIKKSKNSFTDPVCGMEVTPSEIQYIQILNNKKYYFCTESCRSSFEKDPQKYLDLKSPKRKSLWCRYMDRLQKATGGKPLKCH